MPRVGLEVTVEVLRVYALCPAVSELLRHSTAYEPQPLFVEPRAQFIGAAHPDQRWRAVRHEAKAFLTLSKGFLALRRITHEVPEH